MLRCVYVRIVVSMCMHLLCNDHKSISIYVYVYTCIHMFAEPRISSTPPPYNGMVLEAADIFAFPLGIQ